MCCPACGLSLSGYGQSGTFVGRQREEDKGGGWQSGRGDWELDGDYLPEDKQAACQKTKNSEGPSVYLFREHLKCF